MQLLLHLLKSQFGSVQISSAFIMINLHILYSLSETLNHFVVFVQCLRFFVFLDNSLEELFDYLFRSSKLHLSRFIQHELINVSTELFIRFIA